MAKLKDKDYPVSNAQLKNLAAWWILSFAMLGLDTDEDFYREIMPIHLRNGDDVMDVLDFTDKEIEVIRREFDTIVNYLSRRVKDRA